MKNHDYELEYDFLEASKKGTVAERVYHYFRVGNMVKMINQKNLRILDLGCGTGILFEHLCNGNFLVGMDLSKWCIFKAREHAKKSDLDPNLIVANIFYIPLKKNIFDLIILSGVVEHLRKNPKTIIGELSGLLRKNGKILVSLPYNNTVNPLANKKVFDFFRKILSGRTDIEEEGLDFHKHYTLKELKNLFKGFKVLKASTTALGTELCVLFQKKAS